LVGALHKLRQDMLAVCLAIQFKPQVNTKKTLTSSKVAGWGAA
jgi:hypothetical protein